MHQISTEGFQLSPQQKHLWLVQQVHRHLPYRSQFSLLITGQLDEKRLRWALGHLANRYEILRTTFQVLPEMLVPLQVIAEADLPLVHNHDFSHLGAATQAAQIEALQRPENQPAFDFSQPPLWHSLLVKMASQQHLLLVSLPALCADAGTVKLFIQELYCVYAAETVEENSIETTLQYADLAEWQNELFTSKEGELGKAYWRNLDLGAHFNLKLPYDNCQPESLQFAPQVCTVDISSPILSKLDGFSQQCKTSSQTFLLICWQVLLWKFTGQSNLLIGTCFNGRNYEELTDAFGLFAKHLPIICRLEGSMPLMQVVQQVASTLNEAAKWQESFNWEDFSEQYPDSSHVPFFPYCFEFDQWPEQWAGHSIAFSLHHQLTYFDRFKVKLNCIRQGDVLTAEFHYDANLFLSADIQQLAEAFQKLLMSATTTPEAPIGKLDMVSDRHRQQLLHSFASTVSLAPAFTSSIPGIHTLFEAQAAKHPDRLALVYEDQQLTYAELNLRATQLANYLRSRGVGPDVVVPIYLERSLELITAMLAVLKAGGAYLPLDPALPKAGLDYRLSVIQYPILLTQQSLTSHLDVSTPVFCLDTDIPARALSLPACPLSPQHLAYLIFTSGSTGQPKAVMVEHRQLFNYVQGIQARLNLPTPANFATVSTVAADLGNTVIFAALCSGGCLHVIAANRASDPLLLAHYFHQHTIDCLKIVPSHLGSLLGTLSGQSIVPPQQLILGGEATSWHLIEQLRQRAVKDFHILNHYGPTETTVGVLTYATRDRPTYHGTETVPLGYPLANTVTYVLDEYLQPVPLGAPGELYISGAGLTRGYFDHPELTAERFIPNPFCQEVEVRSQESGVQGQNSKYPSGSRSGVYKIQNSKFTVSRLYKTGDRVRHLPDGGLEFLGRVDKQVKIRGFRVELGEIEAKLGEHPGVNQAIVTIWTPQPGDNRLAAYVVRQPEPLPAIADLRQFLREELPDYMMPAAWIPLQQVPITANGNIDYQNLPAPSVARSELTADYVAPRTEVEATLATIWAETLQIDKVGIYDDFFDLGGHSLLAIQVVSRLRATVILEPSMLQVFEAPTVADFATIITQQLAAEVSEADLAEVLADIETLSEEEIETALTMIGEEAIAQEASCE